MLLEAWSDETLCRTPLPAGSVWVSTLFVIPQLQMQLLQHIWPMRILLKQATGQLVTCGVPLKIEAADLMPSKLAGLCRLSKAKAQEHSVGGDTH